MKFKTLKIKNFRSYGDKETEINLDINDIILIFGKVGIGKTSCFDAILWAIYGECDYPVDEIVNRITKKNCKVEFQFEIKKDKYSIIRYRNHDTNKNDLLFFKNNKNISLKKNQDTQKLILEIVEIPYKVMTSTLILSSELYKSFLRSLPSERLSSMELVFSLKEINELYTIVKKNKDKLKENKLSNEKELIKIDSEINVRNNTLTEYKENIKTKLLELKEKRDGILAKIKEIEEKEEEASFIDIEKQIKLLDEYENVISHNEILNELIAHEEANLYNLKNIENKLLDMKNEYLNLKKINIPFELNTIKENKEIGIKENELNSQIEILKSKLINLDDLMSLENSLKRSLQKESVSLDNASGNDSVCPKCGQVIKNQIKIKIISDIQNEINRITKELNELKEKKEKAEKINVDIKEKISIFERDLGIIKTKYTISFYNESELLVMKDRISVLTNELLFTKKDYDEKKEKNKSILLKIESIKTKLIISIPTKPKYSREELLAFKESKDQVKIVIDNLRKEIAIIESNVKALYDINYVSGIEKVIKELRNDLKKQSEAIALIDKDIIHHDVTLNILSNKNDGFKKYVIEKMIGKINKEINKYLTFFFENLKINFDKDLECKIEKDGKEISFGTLSSGQKMEADICTAFAIFKVSRNFFGTGTNLMVIDEIIDRNLDQDGVNGVIEILKSIANDIGIFVVSHRDEYKEKFSRSIMIDFDEDGFSRLNY